MRGEARERPSGSPFERVVRFFLMETEILGEFAADEVFFQKRFLILVRSGRAVYGDDDFFRREVAVPEMRGNSGRGARIGIVSAFGISRKPKFHKSGEELAGLGLPSPVSGHWRERTVATGGFEFFRNGFRGRSEVGHGQLRQFRAGDFFRNNELLPKLGPERAGSDFELAGNRPRRNGASGIDLENGNAGGFANRLAQFELRADRRKIENRGGEIPFRDMFSNPFGRVIPKERKERDAEFFQSDGHVRERSGFRRKVPKIPVRPRSVRNGEHDERNVPIVREFGGEKQSPVSSDAHFAVANVGDRAFSIRRGREKLSDASGIGKKRTTYR